MRKFIYVFCFSFQLLKLNAQEKLSYYDSNGQKTSKENSSVLLQQVKLNDTLWQFNVYNTNGPRIKSIQSNDENGNVVNGKYITYDFWGYIDTLGYAFNGIKEKTWNVYFLGYLVKQITYENGIVIKERDSIEINNTRQKYADSMKAINNGELHESEAEFTNGDKGWQDYMLKNFHYPDQLINDAINGTVIIQFVISAEGKVEDVEIFKSEHYLLDAEAFKLIKNSVGWQSALQNGKKVKSYKKQPLQFKVSNR